MAADLIEDRNRLATLLTAAQQVDAARDAKLAKLRDMIEDKCRQPINAGNRKIIIFTAFSDTAQYLYANWRLGPANAGHRRCTGHRQRRYPDHLPPGLRKSMSSVHPRPSRRAPKSARPTWLTKANSTC